MKKILFTLFFCITMKAEFKLGIENIPHQLVTAYSKQGLRIGLVTNQTGIDKNGNRTLDILLKHGFNIKYIFAPEHGYQGSVLAEKEIFDTQDKKTNIPIISLYTKNTGKKISNELINSIDVLFFDIQDSGMRHYTYISTLFSVLKVASNNNKKVVVFDRPNLLGKIMEGPLVESSLISFISIAPIPLRHGLTVGELAEYFNKHLLENKVALTIIPMKDYNREQLLNDLHAPLSPNISCIASCYGYSFLGLLGEVKPFDVGVGTPYAFQLITLPESLSVPSKMWETIALKLKSHGIPTQAYRYFNERKKEFYKGLRITISNINQVNAFQAFLETVQAVTKQGIAIDFNVNFDKAVGSRLVRSFLIGTISYKDLVEEINNSLQVFFQQAKNIFKYLPHPELVFY